MTKNHYKCNHIFLFSAIGLLFSWLLLLILVTGIIKNNILIQAKTTIKAEYSSLVQELLSPQLQDLDSLTPKDICDIRKLLQKYSQQNPSLYPDDLHSFSNSWIYIASSDTLITTADLISVIEEDDSVSAVWNDLDSSDPELTHWIASFVSEYNNQLLPWHFEGLVNTETNNLQEVTLYVNDEERSSFALNDDSIISSCKVVCLNIDFPYLTDNLLQWEKYQTKDILFKWICNSNQLTDTVSIDHKGLFSETYLSFVNSISDNTSETIICGINSCIHPWQMALHALRYFYICSSVIVVAFLIYLWFLFQKLSQKLEQMNRIQKNFTNTIAHEIKTPLAITRGLAENLAENSRPEKRNYYLQKLIAETEEMDQLVAEIIRISKLSSDQVHLKNEELILNKIILNLINSYSDEAQLKNIHFIFKQTGTFHLIGDPDYIRLALENLFSNAICYGKENTNIQIGCSSCEFHIQNICSDSSDITMASRPDQKHHGLGLYLTENICRLHNLAFSYNETDHRFLVSLATDSKYLEKAPAVQSRRFLKQQKEKLKVIDIRYRSAVMPSTASSRSGFSMAMSNAYIVGIFEKENGEIISLRMSEKQAVQLKCGIMINALHTPGKLINFH